MAIYGNYETVAEVGRSRATTVSKARPADGGWDMGFEALGSDAEFALKAFHVRRAEDAGAGEISRFLLRVRDQKRIYDAGGKHWAPVFEAGQQRNDAYYVTRLYPASAQSLAGSDSPVDAAMLHCIVTGILQGLTELKQKLGRPHGNLKLSNVLLKHGWPHDPHDVALCDPALEADATIAGEVEDLFNLGEIIHHLVTRQPFAGQHTWPVKIGPPWEQLGSTGPWWLDFCNRLLSPRAAENWLRVDDVLDDVAALRPARRKMRDRHPRLRAAALSLLALAIGGGAFEYFRYQHLWRDLCDSYASWVEPLNQQLADAPPLLAADPHIREHLLAPLEEAGRGQLQLDPRRIAGAQSPLAELAAHAPLSFSAVWNTERACWTLAGIERSLSQRNWPALQQVLRQKENYESRGWQRLSHYAATLADGAVRQPGSVWWTGIAQLVEGSARLARLDAAREALVSRQDRLFVRAEASPILRAKVLEFQKPVREALAVDALLPSSAAVEVLCRQLEETNLVTGIFEEAAPTLAEAAKRQRAYEVRGWSKPAKFLSSLLERVTPGAPTQTSQAAKELAAASQQWEKVEAQWARLENRRRLLETSGDRILASYHLFITQSGLGQQPDIAALLEKLEQINDEPLWDAAARRVAAAEWANFDVIAFATRSAAHRAYHTGTPASPAQLRQWLSEIDGYGTQLASATMQPLAPAKPEVIETRKPSTPLATPATAPSISIATGADQKPPVAATKPSPATAPTPSAVVSASTRPAPIPAGKASPATAPAVAVATRPIPAIDPEKVRLETEVANFIIECREVGIPATNPQIKDAWRAQCDRLAAAVQKDHKSVVASKALRQRIRGRLVQLDSAYRSVSAPLKLDGTAAAWQKTLLDGLAAHMRHEAAALLKELIDLAPAEDGKFESRLHVMVDADEQWRGSAIRLIADASRLETLLAQGYTLTERAADGTDVSATAAAVSSSELMKVPDVAKALDPVLAGISRIEGAKDAQGLRQLASAGDLPLGLRLTAWAKVGSQATAATLEQDLTLGGELLASAQAANIGKKSLRQIKGSIEQGLRSRWIWLLDHPTAAADVEAAIKHRQTIPVVDPSELSPRARFNLVLSDLRAAADTADGQLPARVAPVAQRVRAAAAELGGEKSAPQITTLLAQLDELETPPMADPTTLGPMSKASAAGTRLNWSVRAEPDGSLLVYRAAVNGGQPRLTFSLAFRRVMTSAGAPASYVCTTELSMGLLDDLLTASGQWPGFREQKLLMNYEPTRDPRQGPRVWEWPRYGRTPGIARAMLWLAPDFVPAGADHYPETIGSEFNRSVIRDAAGERSEELNPSRRQPMQYISANAASAAAALAGCRLPTISEWQAAYHSPAQQKGANLRDRTWRLELEHMSRIAGRWRPDAGMFRPATEQPSDQTWRSNDGRELEDGVLWFRPVPPESSLLADLAGNVAEFVTADQDTSQIYVIGGSALSPPERPLDKPLAVGADQLTSGFSDVGLRLAFSAPPPSREKFRQSIAGNWYLLSK